MSLAALGFLGPEPRAEVVTAAGGPWLDAGYRSSVPGLYFTGLPAAASFGPVMRFVRGTAYAYRRGWRRRWWPPTDETAGARSPAVHRTAGEREE